MHSKWQGTAERHWEKVKKREREREIVPAVKSSFCKVMTSSNSNKNTVVNQKPNGDNVHRPTFIQDLQELMWLAGKLKGS